MAADVAGLVAGEGESTDIGAAADAMERSLATAAALPTMSSLDSDIERECDRVCFLLESCLCLSFGPSGCLDLSLLLSWWLCCCCGCCCGWVV